MIAFSAQLFVMPTLFSLFGKKRKLDIEVDAQGKVSVVLPECVIPIVVQSASATLFGVIIQIKRVKGLPRSVATTLWCPPFHSHILALRRWVVWLSRSPVEA
jgi:hypothetical protein